MKKLLSDAINGIDWNTPESLAYILHSKGQQKALFVENILLYLEQVTKLDFFSKKLIDGVRKQKVDIIEVNNDIESNHFIINPESKEKIAVARLIDLGQNVLSQPADYNINKTLSDIKKRTVTQKISNEYYTIQVLLDITKPKNVKREEGDTEENEKIKAEKLIAIENDYKKLDPDHVKLNFKLSDDINHVNVSVFICGGFNTSSWETIDKSFADYKTLKGHRLPIFQS